MFFLAGTLIFGIFSLAASIFDVKFLRVPRILIVSGIVFYLGFLFFFSINPSTFKMPLIGAAVSFAVYFFVFYINGAAFGFADVLMGCFAGLYSGFPACFFSMACSALIGLLFFVFSVKFIPKKENVITPAFGTFKIPYVPFIGAGAIIVKLTIRYLL